MNYLIVFISLCLVNAHQLHALYIYLYSESYVVYDSRRYDFIYKFVIMSNVSHGSESNPIQFPFVPLSDFYTFGSLEMCDLDHKTSTKFHASYFNRIDEFSSCLKIAPRVRV